MKEKRAIIECPQCRRMFRVRQSLLGRSAKCPKCQRVFTLAVPEYHNEDEIMNWLDEAAQSNQAPDATAAGLKVTDELRNGLNNSATAEQVMEKRPAEKLHLHSISDMGGYFWFLAEMLVEEDFRTSLPKICANCLTNKELNVHLVQWPSKLPGWDALGKKEQHNQAVIKLSSLPDVKVSELLKHLPQHENLPYPYKLPFPYYVCEHCSPVGLIITNTSFSSKAERCWLTISNLILASRLLARVCGSDNDAYRKLCKRSELVKEDHWRTLPLAVRTRISKWFKIKEGENFLDYLPDEDFSKAEAGIAGLVITDCRSVYHKYQTWREYPLNEPLTVTTKSTTAGTRVEMFSPAAGRSILKLDSKSRTNLKERLSGLEARVKFVG